MIMESVAVASRSSQSLFETPANHSNSNHNTFSTITQSYSKIYCNNSNRLEIFDSGRMSRHSMKRDRMAMSPSSPFDEDEEVRLQKRLLIEKLDTLSLKTNDNLPSANLSDISSSNRNIGPFQSRETLPDDEDTLKKVAGPLPLFSRNKRYMSKADLLVEDIIRKSRRLSEYSMSNSSNKLFSDALDEIPSAVGPNPRTDMQISTYWPSEWLSELSSSPSNFPNQRIQLYQNQDDDDDDSFDVRHKRSDWHIGTGMPSQVKDIFDKPRMSGSSTHIGIIEEIDDNSSRDLSKSEKSSPFRYKTDEVVGNSYDMDIDQNSVGSESSVSAVTMDTSRTNAGSKYLSDSNSDDDVIDILTV